MFRVEPVDHSLILLQSYTGVDSTLCAPFVYRLGCVGLWRYYSLVSLVPLIRVRVAHVAPIRAWCFNSNRTSFHVALELEHVESVDLRSAIRKADAVLPAFAREGQRGHTLKRVAWRGRCRLLFRLGVQHIFGARGWRC